MTTADRTIALLRAIDAHVVDLAKWRTSEDLALLHLSECLQKIVRAHPGVAEMAETYAARAAEELDLVEREP